MDRLVGEHLLADFLLHVLTEKACTSHLDHYGLGRGYACRDSLEFINDIGRSINAISPGGVVNTSNAIADFVRQYRSGTFGRMTLDDIPIVGDRVADDASPRALQATIYDLHSSA